MFLPLIAVSFAFTSLPSADEGDLRCLAYLSRAAGKVQGDLRLRVDAGAIWYLGRLAARSPSIDPLPVLDRIVSSPKYDTAAYEADKQRCHAELEAFAPRYESWKGTYQAPAAPAGSASGQ